MINYSPDSDFTFLPVPLSVCSWYMCACKSVTLDHTYRLWHHQHSQNPDLSHPGRGTHCLTSILNMCDLRHRDAQEGLSPNSGSGSAMEAGWESWPSLPTMLCGSSHRIIFTQDRTALPITATKCGLAECFIHR